MSIKFKRFFQIKDYGYLVLDSILFRLNKMNSDRVKDRISFIYELQNRGIQIQHKDKKLNFEFEVNRSPVEFIVRDNSSDAQVFNQIFFHVEYQFIVDLFQKLEITPINIIDAGANVGYSTIFLSAFFKNTNFICLEPSEKNFSALSENIKKAGIDNRTILLKKALWNSEACLTEKNDFRDRKDWSFAVKISENPGTIKSTTITKLLTEFKFPEIDFLKIDIEGAEAEVFNDISVFQDLAIKVKVLAIEIHDEVSDRFFIENSLQEAGFKIFHSGEMTIAVQSKLINNK